MMEERTLAGRCAAVSERGRRRVNQDAVLIAQLGDGRELVAVADGMGGHAAGEVASQRALEVLRMSLEQGVELADAVRAANTAIFTAATSQPEYQGMGTTLVALLRDGAHYSVANVGDSRAYRIDAAGVSQLTEDHSFVAEAVRSGLSAEEAEKSRWRNAVTRALGTEAELEVDCYGPFGTSEPHAVVLCTDGLHRVVGPQELRRVVLAAAAPDDAVLELTLSAFDAGSDDNITVALVRFGSEPAAAPSADDGASGIPAVDPARLVRFAGPPVTAPTDALPPRAGNGGRAQAEPEPPETVLADAAIPPAGAMPSAAAVPSAGAIPYAGATEATTADSARPVQETVAQAKHRARSRPHLGHRGWTRTRGVIIFLAFIAVIVYVALLLLVF